MIHRNISPEILAALNEFPATALIGARQTGKTTLAKALATSSGKPFIYLDLERPTDLSKLSDPELYLEMHADKLVILDEIQQAPGLFPVLRSLIDADRVNGRFLILGSASPDLIRQSSQSLAGRIRYIELGPFSLSEVGASPSNVHRLWERGGFPQSFLAGSDAASMRWRESFVQTYLERDIPALGIRIPSVTLRRFWQMIAHNHGQLWNASKIASSLGVTSPTARHYLDVLEDTFVVRQLQPFHANLKKRIVKSPKVYLRDSGLLHTLLKLETLDDILGHPAVGASWEGWVIEQLVSLVPASATAYFYRTVAGAEIDLILELPGPGVPLAFEIKRSSAPTLSKGFQTALDDLGISNGYVVCPCKEMYPLGKNVTAVPTVTLPTFISTLLR